MMGIVWVTGLIGCRGAWKGERGKTVDSTWRQRLNLKRAVPPPMNTDGHGLAAYGRATPPHPGKGNAEKLKPNPGPPPLPISAFAPAVSSLQQPFLGSTNGTRFSQAPDQSRANAGWPSGPGKKRRRRGRTPKPGGDSDTRDGRRTQGTRNWNLV